MLAAIYRYLFISAMILTWLPIPRVLIAQNLVPNTTERAALLALYNSTNGANWSVKWRLSQIENYPDSVPPGVHKSGDDIDSIGLVGRGLSGSLPAELNTLTQLKYLLLGSNNLTGAIPTLSNLTHLRTLDLTNHDFTGAFPTWIGSLTSLLSLRLTSNPGSSAKLTGPIPSSISSLTSLSVFEFGNNDLSSANSIPTSFSSLDNLGFLDFHACLLQPGSVTTGLTGLSDLSILNLNFNPSFVESSGLLPDKLSNLPSLIELDLEGNGFNEFPTSFTSLTTINYLDLGNTNYSDTVRLSSVIDVLKSCSSIKKLNLTNCQIARLPSDFDELPTEDLTLSNNNLIPAQCEELGLMPALKKLRVYTCNLSTLPANLSSSTSLQELYASFNAALHPVPDVVRDIPNLKLLEMNSDGLTSLPNWFGTGESVGLEDLRLTNNSITTFPENFTKLSSLKYLTVASNHLDGTWPSQMDSLTSLLQIDLSNNQIDSLPDMSHWHLLQSVNVSHNILSGEVPLYLFNYSGLKTFVDISFNGYSNFNSLSNFNLTSPTVIINNNAFTFEDVLHFYPLFKFTYSNQDSVDVRKTVYAAEGGFLKLVAAVDSALSPTKTSYQWFRYINGTNDLVVSAPSLNPVFILSPIHSADAGSRYYYVSKNNDAPALVLKSRLQTLIINCTGALTAISFQAKRHLCAVNFKASTDYSEECGNTNYNWNFGDGGSSTERSPWHSYGTSGTYSVTLKINFACGPCLADTTITRQVVYSRPSNGIRDSVLTINTTEQSEILSVSAATFSDAWPLQHSSNVNPVNPYFNGSQGVWRNDGVYVYDVPRSPSKNSSEVNISKDGTFMLDKFNYSYATSSIIPNWVQANSMTQYSPYSYELENVDVLGVYSSALYDYFGQLPTANGVNMRNNEMAYTGFEQVDGNITGNLIFGNQPVPVYSIYNVRSAIDHVAIVEATVNQIASAVTADVSAKGTVAFAPRAFFWFMEGTHQNQKSSSRCCNSSLRSFICSYRFDEFENC